MRRRLEHAMRSPGLPGIEELLLDGVVISTPAESRRLGRDEAAGWLRQHAGPGLRLSQFDRHHHVALLVTQTEGWPARPPIRSGRVGFSFHLHDPAGRQDDDHGTWMIDLIIVE